MELMGVREPTRGGFNFDNCSRNCKLVENGFKQPKSTKTGTTIAGIVFNNGVILGGDTRATVGLIVSDKNCVKIHYLRKNIYCCGAGTAADTNYITNLLSSQMELHYLNTGRTPRVLTVCRIMQQRLFRYKGNISAALVLGGVDDFGPHLYSLDPDGSADAMPFASMGSGSLAAMSVLERQFQPNMSEKKAKKLLYSAILAGGMNDLGSGCYIDMCIIRKDETVYQRNISRCVQPIMKLKRYDLALGSTKVLQTVMEHLNVTEEDVEMDFS